ncbi:MAG: von Willebrand factor type A domain-containing protein [Gammaproteobacteria bacterium]
MFKLPVTQCNIIKHLLFLLILTSMSTAHAIIPKHISSSLHTGSIIENRIKVKAPDIAENGAVVTVSVGKVMLDKPGIHVTDIWIFDQSHPDHIAAFKLSPRTMATGISTRIKLAGTSDVYIVAKLSDGRFISGQKRVKVTIGGCGGGDAGYSTSSLYRRPGPTPFTTPMPLTYNNEKYGEFKNNGVVVCQQQPLSTFSIDVDTGSYSNVRRFIIGEGKRPVADAVRVEEMINYFDYSYTPPKQRDVPFSIHTEVGPNPWNKDTHLLHIGLKGYEEEARNIPASNLVFLMDVSGSMHARNKLPLLVNSLKLLAKQMREQDSIAIVVYAGASGVVLPPTRGDQHDTIIGALENLRAGGSTNGGAGIQLAYRLAEKSFIKDGINRVILATDGDFNVGVTSHTQLVEMVKEHSKQGINLTTLGFGGGNYNERLIEQLADQGNGNYAYIDSFLEARKVLKEQMSGTLYTIAKDVKIQVEFNPATVAEYRLIGYENRMLRAEDFRNDKVDAGDIGAGHTVTAIYELTLTDSQFRHVPRLRYSPGTETSNQCELAIVKLRYKLPDTDRSTRVERIISADMLKNNMQAMSASYRFSASVAAFGQWLRKHKLIGNIRPADIRRLAESAREADTKGYRQEFIRMVDTAATL